MLSTFVIVALQDSRKVFSFLLINWLRIPWFFSRGRTRLAFSFFFTYNFFLFPPGGDSRYFYLLFLAGFFFGVYVYIYIYIYPSLNLSINLSIYLSSFVYQLMFKFLFHLLFRFISHYLYLTFFIYSKFISCSFSLEQNKKMHFSSTSPEKQSKIFIIAEISFISTKYSSYF